MGSGNAGVALRKPTSAAWCVAIIAVASAASAADLPFGLAATPPVTLSTRAPQRLTLVWFDVQGQLPAGFIGMANEVRSIFSELGVEVAWRRGGPGTTYGDASGPEIGVIALREDPSFARRDLPILGLVQREQQPTRNVWAFMAAIKRTVGIDPASDHEPLPSQVELLARALGRVIAHEVVHSVAPEHPHDASGLMRHALSRDMLVGSRGSLGNTCATAIRAGLAAWSKSPAFQLRPMELIVAGP